MFAYNNFTAALFTGVFTGFTDCVSVFVSQRGTIRQIAHMPPSAMMLRALVTCCKECKEAFTRSLLFSLVHRILFVGYRCPRTIRYLILCCVYKLSVCCLLSQRGGPIDDLEDPPPPALLFCLCLVGENPDVLRPGKVGMRGSMVIRLRPCTN